MRKLFPYNKSSFIILTNDNESAKMKHNIHRILFFNANKERVVFYVYLKVFALLFDI